MYRRRLSFQASRRLEAIDSCIGPFSSDCRVAKSTFDAWVLLDICSIVLAVFAVVVFRSPTWLGRSKSTDEIVDSTRIQPVGGDHAIEVMAIGIEWAAPPLGEELLTALQAVYETQPDIKGFLPILAPMKEFLVEGAHQFGVSGGPEGLKFDPSQVVPPKFIARNGGFDLQRFDTKGAIAWALSVRPQFVSVNCTAYDRWKSVKPQALKILRPFVKVAMENGTTIGAIGLQYQDAFRLLDGPSPQVTRELFRQNGQYLPMHIFEQPTFWHCHQGWFSESPNQRRVLNNVATEVSEANGAHYARIGGQHRVFATGIDGLVSRTINASEIEVALQFLHDENIKVINGILSDGALEAIGCAVGGT